MTYALTVRTDGDEITHDLDAGNDDEARRMAAPVIAKACKVVDDCRDGAWARWWLERDDGYEIDADAYEADDDDEDCED